MADESSSKQLITEDEDLRSVFLAMMRNHFAGWPVIGARGAPVFVRRADGVNNALYLMPTVWKTSGLQCLGIIVDADDSFTARWERIARFARNQFSVVPDAPPPGGLILADGSGKQFGAWIMPDNSSAGMLETFCHPLVLPAHDILWRYAKLVADEAKAKGAGYIHAHKEKAYIHTFLAWTDPPGQPIGRAMTAGCLDCKAHGAMAFVQWCKRLFRL